MAALRALDAASLHDGSYMPSSAFPRALLGRLYYEWNQFDAALDHLLASVQPLSSITGMTTDPMDSVFALTMLRQAQGDSAGATALVEEAQRHFAPIPISPAFRNRLGAIKARLALIQGDLATAARWADGHAPLEEGEPMRPIHAFAHLTWARIRLAQGASEQADELLSRLRSAAESQALHGISIKTAVLQALCQQAQGNLDAALGTLKRALALALPEGYVRTFVDEGETMKGLLKQCARRGITPEYVLSLLAAFEATGKAPAPLRPVALIEPLSEREIEVLQLLAEGLSNREIAERLVISSGTAKRHVANIFGKLDVTNRTRAVTRGRELKLLGQ